MRATVRYTRSGASKMSKVSDYLRSIGACSEARSWANRYTDAQTAWNACTRHDWIIWLFVRKAPRETVQSWLRTAVLRAVRLHAANALSAAGLHKQANALSCIANDASFADMRTAANAANAAAYAAYATNAAKAAASAATAANADAYAAISANAAEAAADAAAY